MVRPLAVRRHNEIVQRLRAAGSVSVGELADTFSVSHETIRRDLKLLADQGHLSLGVNSFGLILDDLMTVAPG